MTLEQNIGFNSTEGRDSAYHLPPYTYPENLAHV